MNIFKGVVCLLVMFEQVMTVVAMVNSKREEEYVGFLVMILINVLSILAICL